MRAALPLLPALMLMACGQNVVLDYDIPDQNADVSPAPDVRPDIPPTPLPDMSEDTSLDVTPDILEDMPADIPADMPPQEDMPSPAYHAARYPFESIQSPLTPYVLDRLEEIGARGPGARDDVFIKVGDSNTVNPNFLRCLATGSVNLDGRDLQATLDHFKAGEIEGESPYVRDSAASVVGWSASSAIAGSPSPVEQEITTASPRFATVMFGTNDIQRRKIFDYADQMFDLVDVLTERGVIPLLTTIPARRDDVDADAWVAPYNAVVRGLAQARQVPLFDLHTAIEGMPTQGLGGDGLHLNTAPAGACDFTMTGVAYGHNARNLHTLTALDRLKRAWLDGGDAPDPLGAPLAGDGRVEDPLRIDTLPFVDLRDTSQGPQDLFDAYPGCDATQNESGPEFVYQLVLDAPTTIQAMVFDRGDVDIDLHILDDTGAPSGCVERAHQTIEATLEAGTYHLVLDTFVSRANGERSGEYLVVVLAR